MVFLKQIVGGALEDVADRFEIFKLYTRSLVVDYAVEILVAETKLNIKPILCLALFLKNVKNS